MYCPICFNQTLKIASTGVVRVAFNQKSRNTSQFFYDLKRDRTQDIDEKFRKVVKDYFSWYASFQNKSAIKTVELTTMDFVCSRGCKMNQSCRMSAIDLIILYENVKKIVEEEGNHYKIPIALERN